MKEWLNCPRVGVEYSGEVRTLLFYISTEMCFAFMVVQHIVDKSKYIRLHLAMVGVAWWGVGWEGLRLHSHNSLHIFSGFSKTVLLFQLRVIY